MEIFLSCRRHRPLIVFHQGYFPNIRFVEADTYGVYKIGQSLQKLLTVHRYEVIQKSERNLINNVISLAKSLTRKQHLLKPQASPAVLFGLAWGLGNQ